jgi:type IV secretory pathway VirB10-like protein
MPQKIKELIANLQKEGKSADDILKAVNDYKDETPPPTPPAPTPAPDDSIRDKVIKDQQTKATRDAEGKKMEVALRFDMARDKFIEDHKSILPKEVSEIFAKADKETFESAIDKANAIRASILESFFSQQANIDLLTVSQKGQIEDFLKLTRKARDEKSEELFMNVFEPTLEMVKRIKKAEQVGKSRHPAGDASGSDDAYKLKLMSGSKQRYLGEK